MSLCSSNYEGVQERLQRSGYDPGTIVMVFDYLSSLEQEREIFGEAKQAPLCNTGRAKLWREAIDDLLGKRLREVQAMADEMRETQEKVHLLVKASKLTMFKERLQSKFEGFKRRAFSMLDDAESFIRREHASQPVTAYVSVGGTTTPYEPMGKPTHYLEAEEQVKARNNVMSVEEIRGPQGLHHSPYLRRT
jgi:hypothetical protein